MARAEIIIEIPGVDDKLIEQKYREWLKSRISDENTIERAFKAGWANCVVYLIEKKLEDEDS